MSKKNNPFNPLNTKDTQNVIEPTKDKSQIDTEKPITDLYRKLSNLDTKLTIIGITPRIYYSEILRMASFFATDKYRNPIIINKSVISQPVQSVDFFATINMSDVIKFYDSDIKLKPLDMKFEINKEDIKKLKSIRGNAVAIINDTENNKYIINDGNSFVDINKSRYDELTTPPDLKDKIIKQESLKDISLPSDINDIGIIIQSTKELKEYSLTCKRVILELYDNELQYIIFNNNTKYIISPENASEFENAVPELYFYSYDFLKIAGNENCKLLIAYDDKDYWLITKSKIGEIDITTYERLHKGYEDI